MPPTQALTRSPRAGGYAGYAVGLLLLICLFFVIRGEARAAADWKPHPVALLESFAAALAASILSAVGWQQALLSAGIRTTFREASRTWYVSMIARYIPGAVAGIASRVYLARKMGGSRSAAVTATVLDWAAWLLTAAGVGLAGLPWLAQGWTSRLPLWVTLAAAAGALLVMGAATQPRLIRPLLTRAARKLGDSDAPDLSPAALARLFPLAILKWPCYGLAVAAFLPPGSPSTPAVTAAFGWGWIAGFVSPFAPGGLGVREAVFVAALHRPGFDRSLLAAAVLARLSITLAEALCWAWAWLDQRAASRPESGTAQ